MFQGPLPSSRHPERVWLVPPRTPAVQGQNAQPRCGGSRGGGVHSMLQAPREGPRFTGGVGKVFQGTDTETEPRAQEPWAGLWTGQYAERSGQREQHLERLRNSRVPSRKGAPLSESGRGGPGVRAAGVLRCPGCGLHPGVVETPRDSRWGVSE